ncbi:NrfD/PsrC family molybdoenzyme membrane anchor subunit [uncultured Adlercreutzia sp.]|uniref:NrfD/PsrC family molybdoenzyme membrane anchor subunit n=1 Tax=uncultured Adlercreutzia sp. TaxID=875803 RepID=UPI002674EFE6|nr:NrfD/PsrC family molybdoenzyme membrane anchor subunit [uncultured Adlercreutzia sp.]
MFNGLIAAYMFLGGAGAGMALVLAVLALRGLRMFAPGTASGTSLPLALSHRRLIGLGFIVSCGICALGSFCLMADMKRPEALLTLLAHPSLTVSSVGAYALAATVGVSLLLGSTYLSRRVWPCAAIRTALLGCVVLCAVVMTYTGLLFTAFSAAPLFRTGWVVPLFVLSSLSCGCALVGLWAQVSRTASAFAKELAAIDLVDGVVILLESVAMAAFVADAATVAPSSASALLSGDCALFFWTGVVGCGLVLPLAMGAARRLGWTRFRSVSSAPLVLVGGFVLRWCMLRVA